MDANTETDDRQLPENGTFLRVSGSDSYGMDERFGSIIAECGGEVAHSGKFLSGMDLEIRLNFICRVPDDRAERCMAELRQFGFAPSYFPKCGMAFEFDTLVQAEGFASVVWEYFSLGSRIFDDSESAHASHVLVQRAPAVHVDRPFWKLDRNSSKEARDESSAVEQQVIDLATAHGGHFVGT